MSILDVLSSQVLGGALQQMGGRAGSAARTVSRNTPGGMGGLLGAGALGALLGNMSGGSSGGNSMVRNAALLGMGAVALNFYKKWAQAKQAEAAEAAEAQAYGQMDPRGDVFSAGRVAIDPTSLLIMRAVVFAARADGTIDATERQRMGVLFQSLFEGQNVNREFEQMQKEPLDPRSIAREVRSEDQAEDVYRLSCCVIDIDQFMERTYLDALAASLGISNARKNELEAEASQGRRQLDAAARG